MTNDLDAAARHALDAKDPEAHLRAAIDASPALQREAFIAGCVAIGEAIWGLLMEWVVDRAIEAARTARETAKKK